MMSWGTDPSPSTITEIWSRAGGLNWQRYASARFDSLVTEARDATELERDEALWREAYTEFNQDAAVIYTYSPSMFAGIHERFENVSIRPDQWTTTLWTWRIRPGAMIARDRLSGS